MPVIIINGGRTVTNNSANPTQYDGEKIPGDLRHWNYLGSDPNELLRYSYDVLSQRSTTLYHTHPPVTSAINKMTQYAVGPGLAFRSQPDWSILGMDPKKAKKWGLEFQKLVHYIFRALNFYEKQSVLFRTALIQGDSLLLFDRKANNNLPFDLVAMGGDSINFRGNTKKKKKHTTLGVVHDDLYRKSGLILNSGKEINFKDSNLDQNLLQVMFKNMATQMRGFSLAYRMISPGKNNDRWWDATLSRAVMETVIFGTSNESSGEDTFNEQTDSLVDMAKRAAGTSTTSTTGLTEETNTKHINPGAVYSYKGKDSGINFSSLTTPANNFDKMQAAYIDMVGMGTDVPPEVILSRYATSFTAHKGAFNDFIKSYMFYRRRFENNINRPVIREIAKYLFHNKIIEMPHPQFFENGIIQEAVLAGTFLGPVPGHINPLQEVTAKAKAVENAFMLRSDAAFESDNDYDNYMEEWRQEERLFHGSSPDKQATNIQNDINKKEENSK